MGVLDSKDELLAALDTDYATAQTNYYNCLTKESEAYVHYLGGNALAAIEDILWCIMYLRTSITYLTYQSDDNPNSADMIYYLDNYVGDEVTWKSIVEAWVKDDFEGRFWTIGVIDRMRQIMWDEPFDLTWAARPEQREF